MKKIHRFHIFLFIFLMVSLTSCQSAMQGIYETLPVKNVCENWEIDSTKVYINAEKSYKMEIASGNIVIDNAFGTIFVDYSPDKYLYVINEKKAVTEKDMNLVQLTLDNLENKTEISVHYWSRADTLIGFSDLQVLVPKNVANIEIKSKSADVQVNPFDGELRIYSICGDLFVHQTQGNANLQSEYGNVVLTSQRGNVDISTTSGDIICTVLIVSGKAYNILSANGTIYFTPLNSMGEITVKTTTGSIQHNNKISRGQGAVSEFADTYNSREPENYIDEDFGFNPGRNNQVMTQQIEGILGPGDAKINLETINGNIYIR